jgi:hypothetical protein
MIGSFTPTSGPVGTVVTITGTSFTGATAVKFNTTAATAFTVDSDTQITATVPSGATTGKISVTNAVGTGSSANNFTVSGTSPANLLLNPGFELDNNGDGSPDKWTSNSKFTRSAEVVHGGSYAGKHFATDDLGYTIQQVVPSLSAGTTYNFSGWVNIPPTTDSFSLKLQVRWRDASNVTISTQTIRTYTAATSGWNQAAASLVAPAGTTNAQVRMVVSSLNATIYIDDFVFRP